MNTPLKLSDKYNKFLETQNNILESIHNKKSGFKELFDDILKQPKQDIRRRYDDFVNSKEKLKTETINIIKDLDELTIKILEKSQEQKNELNEIVKMLDDFSINLSKAQISTLEELIRDYIKKSNIDEEEVPEPYKSVLKNTFGGKRRKTMKKRK